MLKKTNIEKKIKQRLIKGQTVNFIRSVESVAYKRIKKIRDELIKRGILKKKKIGWAWRKKELRLNTKNRRRLTHL